MPSFLVTLSTSSNWQLPFQGYLNAINPFDQPGVEAYKRNMFALLGKPGFEDLSKELNARL